MAVNLEGFENTPREERKILSIEEFERYISELKRSYDEKLLIYIITETFRRGKVDFTPLYESNNVATKEEFIRSLEEEFEIEIFDTDLEEIIKDLPEEVRSQLPDLLDSITNAEDIENLYKHSVFKNLDELNAIKLKEIATEVSRCDLSQIPPETYARTPFLRYINFQNTGAKLDFKYIKENSKYSFDSFISTENLSGTEIISFDSYLYRRTKEEIVRDDSENYSDWFQIDIKNFDVSQFQVIIDSYNHSDAYVNPNIANFLINQELQDNNKWLIDYAFADLEKRSYLAREVWKNLTPKSQIEYKAHFEKLIDYFVQRKESYYLVETLKNTIPSFIDEHVEDFRKIYINENNGTLDDSFYYQIFPIFSDEYKEKYYQDNKNLKVEERALILSKTRPEYIKENFIDLFENFLEENKNERNYSTPIYQLGKFMEKFRSIELDSSIMNYLIDFTKKETSNNSLRYKECINQIYSYINSKNKLDYYKDFMQIGIDNNVDIRDVEEVFYYLPQEIKEEHFYSVLEFSQSLSPELAHYIRGTGFIAMVHGMNPEKSKEFVEKNAEEILLSFRTKYEDKNNPYVDTLLPNERKEFDSKYSNDYLEILLEMDKKGDLNSNNINIIIDNLPKLGKDVINRLYSSNSEMIRANASQLITAVSTLKREDAIALIEDTERVFSKDTIPDFLKIYKFYQNVVETKRHVLRNAVNNGYNYSPELQQAGTEKTGMRIIFTDLLNISLKSNNKSLKKFIDLLENGNKTYVKYLKSGKDLEKMTPEEREELKKYADTLYTIYDESLVSKHDKKVKGKKIANTKDYTKTLEDLSRRYMGDRFPEKLSDEVLKTVVGRFEEMLAGRKTLEDFRTYMERVNKESNERHAQLEKTKLVLEPGDLIKGIQNATGVLQSLFSNGIRAGEFLGTDNHTDATPLDSDHSLITSRAVGKTLKEAISNTTSNAYGNFFVVIKSNPEKIMFTRDDPEYTFKSQSAPEYQSRLGRNADSEAIRARIRNRINNTFEEPKLEAFSSSGASSDHYGIRTGMAITDVDYIVVSSYDKRIGYELAMNGTFVPVVDINTNEIIFGMDDYTKIREQMQGLSYFGMPNYVVDQSAYTTKVEEKVAQLFPDGDEKESISEKDARLKREAIERKVRSAILEKLGLGFESKITGDITPGFIEFIDTGSTGRGTNLPGDGDFDFSVKIDKELFDNPQKLEEFKKTLREVLAVRSDSEACKLDEFGGNFRYKKVQIDGVEMPLDIDITFMQKAEDVTYSTDMSVKDRLQAIKECDSEGYKRVIANIVLAKEMLKKEGIYKKKSSDGATIDGGFGGVGVENWILQNGGSFVKAMETFLEASERASNFNEFMEMYPIFDFGQNHMAKDYQHDSFIRGLSESGYTKMQTKFKEFIKELKPQQQEISIKTLAKDAIQDGIRSSEYSEASASMISEEQRVDTDKSFEGED